MKAFWSKVDVGEPGQCWLWRAGRTGDGYGAFYLPQSTGPARQVVAHRMALELATGREVPKELCVCHACDNPPCCNPSHLFVGTHQQNATDKARKGRAPSGKANGAHTRPDRRPTGARHGRRTHPECTARGERAGRAKLASEDVVRIRHLASEGATQRGLGRRFGVSHIHIGRIIRRESWAHVGLRADTPNKLPYVGRE